MSIPIPASLDREALLRRFWEVTPVTRLAPPPKAPAPRTWKPEPPKRSIRVWPVPVTRESVEYRFRAEDIDAYLESEIAA
ncbi:MAG: hypothetical protein M3440_04930 [Chloroflexota bacterium]|nr:hypothetical protein [Chloroflexota bacterium]